jgi:hypothetical protein
MDIREINMEFGLQFFPQVEPADKSPQDYFQESVAIAKETESLGFSHAHIVEHCFDPYRGYSPNPPLFSCRSVPTNHPPPSDDRRGAAVRTGKLRYAAIQ